VGKKVSAGRHRDEWTAFLPKLGFFLQEKGFPFSPRRCNFLLRVSSFLSVVGYGGSRRAETQTSVSFFELVETSLVPGVSDAPT
jgi:hypothetical protein